jgi:hypothetical protein
MERDEIHWELGERVMASNGFVPGLFIFVYAGVLGWKWSARAVQKGWAIVRPVNRLQLPPPLKALPPPDDTILAPMDR